MKVKKLFNVFMAATMGLACLPPVTASADSVGEGKVCGKAGIYFQNDQYTARDAVGGTWGPSSGDPAAVPFPVVGVSGGALGWDSNVEQSDTEICGDGTYTIFVSSHGTIDTEGSGWYIDKEKKYTRLGCPWSMLGAYSKAKAVKVK